MTYEQFMKGMTILYAFGMAEKEDWELKIWYRALGDEMSLESYEQCCIHLCKNNLKFWETDNIPAQLLDVIREGKEKSAAEASKRRLLAEEDNRELARKNAMASYDSEEDRLKCIEKFAEMNRKIFRSMPS